MVLEEINCKPEEEEKALWVKSGFEPKKKEKQWENI